MTSAQRSSGSCVVNPVDLPRDRLEGLAQILSFGGSKFAQLHIVKDERTSTSGLPSLGR
jgi:hypothetical protein